ncbi:MAG: HD domain-containing protein [Oscillospiraceae bacterium]|nr:HD domain-containing protein [Oscillospiraceae bacterium]MDY3066230.1 HD domain-containing protein [Oscillospiraceae bacterium]
MVIPRYAACLIEKLNDAGYHTAAVGGCVRDSLLGRIPHDWDLTTAAPWQDVKALLSPEYTVIATGTQHGTVTVLSEGHPVEITTFRIDGVYSDGRRPDSVRFTSNLCDDLARRDFTVNAMAFDGKTLFDPFGGQDDLSSKIIRCVGNPEQRLREDALRILRALRFASVLGFSIEEATAHAIHKTAYLLSSISAERIFSELTKLLCGEFVRNVLLSFSDVFFRILPELKPLYKLPQHNPHHCYDVWTHTVYTVSYAPSAACLRLAALFHDTGKAACRTTDSDGIDHFFGHAKISETYARTALNRLKSDRKTSDAVCSLVKWHDIPVAADDRLILRRLRQFGSDFFFDLLALKEADCLAQSPHPERLALLQNIREKTSRLLSADACFSFKKLAVSGRDLIAAGIPEGKAVGDLLKKLLDAVTDGSLPNDKAALLAALPELLDQPAPRI